MNAAVVCLLVFACILFSQHDVAVASLALRPDPEKSFSDYELDYEDPDKFKQMSVGFYATRDKKLRELSLPPNLYDDSEPLLAKMYSVPTAIDQIDEPDRLNRLFSTALEEIDMSEATDGNISGLRSEQEAGLLGLRTKKEDSRFVGNGFFGSRGKKRFIEYEA